MAKLNEQLVNLTAIINKMKAETANAVNSLCEQNPNITPVSNNPRTFTMNAAFLSGDCILDPFYYDWDAQYDAILAKLEKSSVDSFVKGITELVKTGKLDGRRYHPEVTKRLSILVEEV
jgi:hypothetical protein